MSCRVLQVSELQESLRTKDEAISGLRGEKAQTEEQLSRAVEERRVLADDMEMLKDKLQQMEQSANNLEKQKKSLEGERNLQKVGAREGGNFRSFPDTLL